MAQLGVSIQVTNHRKMFEAMAGPSLKVLVKYARYQHTLELFIETEIYSSPSHTYFSSLHNFVIDNHIKLGGVHPWVITRS